jgi:hypothetical protein
MSTNRVKSHLPDKWGAHIGVPIEKPWRTLLTKHRKVGLLVTTRRDRGPAAKPMADTGPVTVKGGRYHWTRPGRKDARKRWKILRKLNNRFRKTLRKQQQLRADLMQLRKEILEVKQQIVAEHREPGKGS